MKSLSTSRVVICVISLVGLSVGICYGGGMMCVGPQNVVCTTQGDLGCTNSDPKPSSCSYCDGSGSAASVNICVPIEQKGSCSAGGGPVLHCGDKHPGKCTGGCAKQSNQNIGSCGDIQLGCG